MLMLLVAQASCSKGEKIWLEEEPSLPTIVFDSMNYISHSLNSDNTVLTFLTISDIIFYQIKTNSVKFLSQNSHSDLDLFDGVITLYSTHEVFGILTFKDLYLFQILDASSYQIGARRGFPAKYFGLKEFSGVVFKNYLERSIVIKSGTNELIILDLRKMMTPKYSKIVPQTNKGSHEIEHLQILNFGKSIGVMYSDGSFYGVDLKTGSSKFITQIDNSARAMRYDYTSNTLLFFRNDTFKIFHGTHFGLLKAVDNPNKQLFSAPNNIKMKETGMDIILFSVWDILGFFNSKTMEMYPFTLEFPDRVFADEVFRHSNLVLVSQISADTIQMGFRKLKVKNMPDFCHPTCGKACSDPFVTCRTSRLIYLAFGGSLFFSGFIIILCAFTCNTWERRIGKHQNFEKIKQLGKTLEAVVEASEEKDIDRRKFRILVRRDSASKALIETLLDSNADISLKSPSVKTL